MPTISNSTPPANGTTDGLHPERMDAADVAGSIDVIGTPGQQRDVRRGLQRLLGSETGTAVLAAVARDVQRIEVVDDDTFTRGGHDGIAYAQAANGLVVLKASTAGSIQLPEVLAHELTHVADGQSRHVPDAVQGQRELASVWTEVRAYMVGARVDRELGLPFTNQGSTMLGVLRSPSEVARSVSHSDVYDIADDLQLPDDFDEIARSGDPDITRVLFDPATGEPTRGHLPPLDVLIGVPAIVTGVLSGAWAVGSRSGRGRTIALALAGAGLLVGGGATASWLHRNL